MMMNKTYKSKTNLKTKQKIIRGETSEKKNYLNEYLIE